MTAYRFNSDAMRVVRELKKRHRLESEGEVILRALALLDAADEVVGGDGVLTIQGSPEADPSATAVDSQSASNLTRVRVWREEEAAG